jgi:serine/threonine protein kinase
MDLQELKNEVEWKIIEREIQIHSSLDHPHIVKLWNSLIHEDKVYMIMEYAENGNLFYYQNSKIRFTEP